MGSSGLEPPTSRLSGARSNLLSYEPAAAVPQPYSHIFQLGRRVITRSTAFGCPWLSPILAALSLFRDPCLCSLSFASRACPVKAIGLPFHLRDGDDGIRTHDPLLAGQVLSQLSYTPVPLYFRSPGLFPLLGSLFSLRFSSSSRAMKTEQQAFIPDSVLLLFFCRDSFFSISTSESSTVVMIRVSLERR